ncbi:MAG: transglutaminase family protein [Alphaproteobacteria bacterium]|nr:transglutaminase family protein [Alphaproteobacteria bacterium]
MDFDPDIYLSSLGTLPDRDIDPVLAALALCASEHPGLSWGRYVFHLEQLKKKTTEAFQSALSLGDHDQASTRLSVLKHVLADQEGYEGDRDTYDHLDNADMVRVIDRRRGLPVSMALIYVSCARHMGWDVRGLNFPAHVLCRIDCGGDRLVFDPFDRATTLMAPDLRALAKRMMGEQTELSAEWFEPVSTRDLLVRLLNNIKLRQVKAEAYEHAVQTIEKMRLIAPDEYRVLFDAGVLYARVGQKSRALEMLESYLDHAPSPRDAEDAVRLIREIRQGLQ